VIVAIGSVEDGGENKRDEGTAGLRVNQGFSRMKLPGAVSSQDEYVYPEKVKIAIDPSRTRTIAAFSYQVVERRHNIWPWDWRGELGERPLVVSTEAA
jgi:hypothetical protein